jgi:hypothetical protein
MTAVVAVVDTAAIIFWFDPLATSAAASGQAVGRARSRSVVVVAPYE